MILDLLIMPEITCFDLECGHEKTAALPNSKRPAEEHFGSWSLKCDECGVFMLVVGFADCDCDV